MGQTMESDSLRVLQMILRPESIPVVAIVCGCLFGLVSALATQWRKARQKEAEVALKMEMIKQGKSADEIERVLRAGRTPQPKESE
jgi:hypothetical protein